MQIDLDYRNKPFVISLGIIVSVFISYFTVFFGITVPIVSLILCAAIVGLIIVFRNPFVGLMFTLVYCFIFGFIARESGIDFPFGYVEFIYIIIWIAIVYKIPKTDWSLVCNDLCLLFLLWFTISVLELINPASANPRGWLYEIRSSGLDSFLLVPAGFLIFREMKHLNVFLTIILTCSFLAWINGFTQIHIGRTAGEEAFILGNPTHMIWGKLRAFSFYRDAGQFGASQAQLAVICSVLAIGPFKLWKRILLLLLSIAFFYGMMLSGTRGALFALVPGLFIAVLLFKNIKILFSGTVLAIIFLAFLKFTTIGNSDYNIQRLRSAVNPQDESLNVRFTSQRILGEYLKDYPFGGGLGVIGFAGHEYNSDKFLSTIEPDSYWVKVWAMYGIVGFIFWFCLMMYILGKCCGIVWNIRNEKLRVKLIALTAGFFGIFISSYGNEVINTLPSSIVVYLSLVFIFLGPSLDEKLQGDNQILIK